MPPIIIHINYINYRPKDEYRGIQKYLAIHRATVLEYSLQPERERGGKFKGLDISVVFYSVSYLHSKGEITAPSGDTWRA